ncbi:MAG: phosphatidylserine decarboxylase [Gammaproteobacteria bacterium]|nr:phosphatidylserine decarboxylase [Gammaproteobacteria bacterium]
MAERVLTHLDRATGRMISEPVYAGGFLDWSYNTTVGWLVTEFILSRRILTRLYGWFHKSRWSRRKIRLFVKRYRIDMRESRRQIDEFSSFNDFFVREIDLGRRPIDPDPTVCVSPVDGRLLAYRQIDGEREFMIKRSSFDLKRFLGDATLAKRYAGGDMIVCRIYLPDYHHVHFADSGTAHPATTIGRRYWAVSPHSRCWSIPFYSENHRMLTLFDSNHFGQIAMVEIGAFTVGSIQQRYRPGAHVGKGEHKGFFELGGSTVVLLFEPGRIELDRDLVVNTCSGLETFVSMGKRVGRVPSERERNDAL